MFDDLRIHKYIETPVCSRCGSKKTGIFMFNNENFSVFALMEEKRKMKQGQLIRYSNIPLNELGVNLFCDDCGIEWMGRYKIIRLSKNEIEERVAEKFIDVDQVDKMYKVDKKTKKANKWTKRFFDKYVRKKK